MSTSFTARLLFELARNNHLFAGDGGEHSQTVEILPCDHPMCKTVCGVLYIRTPKQEQQPDLMFGYQDMWELLIKQMNEHNKLEAVDAVSQGG